MKRRGLLLIILLSIFLSGFSQQYMLNPSFEGEILQIGPPAEWEICISGSTPNIQPEKYDVFLPPSDGITYVGLLTRDNFTWEDMYTTLNIPLSKDSCYIFKIDLAFWEYLSFVIVDPVILNIYGTNINCQKDNILWTSPPIANEDWETYEFMIHNNEFDITEINIECYYTGTYPYWGYVLLDNIRISQTPQFELGNDTTLTLCENDTLVLDPGGGFTGYLWQDGTPTQTYTVDTTGLYWVQCFNEYGCSWTDSVFVTIEEYVDMVSEMIDSTLVCEGQEVTLTATVINGAEPYSYQWLNLPDTTESITVIVDSTMFYYVVVTDNCGFILMDSIKIVMVENPDINLGNDTLICSDGDYTLHAGSGFIQYLWQDGSNDSLLTVYEPGIYWVEVTSIFGCSARDSITISLFPAIPLDLGNDTILCIGETVTFNPVGEFLEYVWQDNSTDSTYTATTTGIYWVTVTDENGCHATDSVYANFLPLPEIYIGPDTSICEGEDLILDAGGGYVSYLWQNSDTSQYQIVTQGGWYWVTVDNGCGEDTDSLYVEMYPSPEPYLGPDTTLCVGSGLLLDPGSQYVSYLWQDNSTLPFYSANTSGVYSVIVENTYGCFGEDEIYITFAGPEVDLGEDSYICEGEEIILDAGEGFLSYLWFDNTTGQTNSVSTGGTYWVQVTDDYECLGGDTILVDLYPNPAPDLGPDIEICKGETLVITAPEGDYTYYWNGQPGTNEYTVTGIEDTLTLTMVNICDSVSDAVAVTEILYPEVYLGEDDMILPGQTIELDAGEDYDPSLWDPWQYSWQNGSYDPVFIVTEEVIVENGSPYFYVEVSVNNLCTVTDTIRIDLFKVLVPIVITPNGDGFNDYFIPDEENWSGVNQHKIIVFNRWGEQVWESEEFEKGWDGKQNGRYVAEGTYYWILDVFYGPENLKQTIKGTLTVLGTGN